MKPKMDVDVWLGELDRYLRAVSLDFDGVEPPEMPSGATLSMRLLYASVMGFVEHSVAVRSKERKEREAEEVPF